jgi:hypothetical protein
MKKLLVNLFFLSLATWGFSQPAFTEKTIQDMNKRFLTNPLKFLNEEMDPTFILMGAEGQPIGYNIFKGWYATPGFKMNEWSVADLKVQQVSKMGIATGIKTHIISIHDSVVSHLTERFTYFFEFKNNKWMWTYGQHTPVLKPAAEEEVAIKKLLVDERNVFFKGDKEGLSNFWKNDPKTFVNASYPNGNQFYMNQEAVKKAISNFKPNDNAVGTITDSKVHVYGNNAIANLEMTVNHKNGSISKEHDIVLLEKEGEAWKILGYSVHGIPDDKKEDSAAIVKVIEKETQAWRDRDVEGRISCIANVPHALILVHHGNMAINNGVSYVTNEKADAPEKLKVLTAGMGKPNGSTSKNENYVVTIKGGTAFVSYDEVTTAAGQNSMVMLSAI